MNGMERRKSHVTKLNETSENLLNIIGADVQVAINIKSQIADIHDSWNTVVKQSIENGTKVKRFVR